MCAGPACQEDFECGDFGMTYKWRTPEREGHFYELDDIFEWLCDHRDEVEAVLR